MKVRGIKSKKPFACKIGLHKWEIEKTSRCTTWMSSIFVKPTQVPAEARIEHCSRCSARRGIIDIGTQQQVFDAGYIERGMASGK